MNMRMKKAIWLCIILVIILSIAVDPRSWTNGSSDAVLPLSWWHQVPAIGSIILLCVAAIYLFKLEYAKTAGLVFAEAMLSVCNSALAVQQEGVGRFVHGIGAEQLLSWYLALIALRFVLLFSMMHQLSRSRSHD